MTHAVQRSGVLSCSFCGKGQDEVRKLIAGPYVYICDECVALCNDIIAAEPSPSSPGAARGEAPPPAPARPALAAMARLACAAAEADVRSEEAAAGPEAACGDALSRAVIAEIEATIERIEKLLSPR